MIDNIVKFPIQIEKAHLYYPYLQTPIDARIIDDLLAEFIKRQQKFCPDMDEKIRMQIWDNFYSDYNEFPGEKL